MGRKSRREERLRYAPDSRVFMLEAVMLFWRDDRGLGESPMSSSSSGLSGKAHAKPFVGVLA